MGLHIDSGVELFLWLELAAPAARKNISEAGASLSIEPDSSPEPGDP
jgi:hypothetical protein